MPETKPLTVEDLIRITEPPSTDPEYLAWEKAKVEEALKHADEHPDDFLTLDEVWRKFGLAS